MLGYLVTARAYCDVVRTFSSRASCRLKSTVRYTYQTSDEATTRRPIYQLFLARRCLSLRGRSEQCVACYCCSLESFVMSQPFVISRICTDPNVGVDPLIPLYVGPHLLTLVTTRLPAPCRQSQGFSCLPVSFHLPSQGPFSPNRLCKVRNRCSST